MNSKLLLTLITAIVLSASSVARAGTINGGELLDQSGANFLETRLGLGDLDFTNISNLSVGGTSYDWHADVTGYTDVISIYDITFQGQNYLLGGYSAIGHDGLGYSYDGVATAENFVFNLSLGIVHNTQTNPYSAGQYDQYDKYSYFATFGGGHDLFGGRYTLGSQRGYANGSPFYNYGYSYGGDKHLLGAGFGYSQYFSVNGLESFVFSSAASVSEPSPLMLFGLGLAGLGFIRKKRAS